MRSFGFGCLQHALRNGVIRMPPDTTTGCPRHVVLREWTPKRPGPRHSREFGCPWSRIPGAASVGVPNLRSRLAETTCLTVRRRVHG